jgi:predicted alpha/beta superfamily hydrolase
MKPATRRIRSTLAVTKKHLPAKSVLLIVLLLLTLLPLPRTPAMAAEAKLPIHLSLRVPSKVLDETRIVNIHVPDGYDGKSDTRYPVLYMLDGGVAEDFPHLASTLDALVEAGEIPPMLLVGVENTQRRRDLTGPTRIESDLAIAPVVGGSEAFRAFLSDELMPLVQTLYRVNDEASIIGESLAGLFVIETLFLKPALFDTYIALDPSLWWNAQQWWREAGTRLDAMPEVQVRLLLASAGDSGDAAANLADALCRNPLERLRWIHVPRPDLRHDNIYRSFEREALQRMFSGQALAAPECEKAGG